jgi:hypothetical protein
MATVANLVVKVAGDITALTRSLSSASAKIGSFVSDISKSLLKIGTIIAGSVVAAATGLYYMLEKTRGEIVGIGADAEKLGVSFQAFQKLAFQAKIADTNIESVSGAMKIFQRNVGDAALGTGQAEGALNKLGLSAQLLKSFAPEKQLYEVARAQRYVTDQTEKANILSDIFGRNWSEILPLLNSNLDESGRKFDSLGANLSDKGLKAVRSWDDASDTIGTLWQGFKQNTTAAVAPAFEVIATHLEKTIASMGGIKNVAKDMAVGIVTAIIAVVEATQTLLKNLTKIEIGFEKAKLAAQFLGVVASQSQERAPELQGIDKFNIEKQNANQANFKQGQVDKANQIFAPGLATIAALEKSLTEPSLVSQNLQKLVDALKATDIAKTGISSLNSQQQMAPPPLYRTGNNFSDLNQEVKVEIGFNGEEARKLFRAEAKQIMNDSARNAQR